MLNSHLEKMIFLGTLTIKEDGFFDYTRTDTYRRKEIIELGDLVYFMVVDGELMKIGKAGGASGWMGRVGTYSRGIYGDATNRRIERVMKNLEKDTIQVYAIQTPRRKIECTCPLTGDIIVEEIAVHRNVELSLTAKYIEAGYELPFCKQLG